jgi:hypothetical protein
MISDNKYMFTFKGRKLIPSNAYGKEYVPEFEELLDRYIPETARNFLEWGSGHSTLMIVEFLKGRACHTFYSLEHDPTYLAAVASAVGDLPFYYPIYKDITGPGNSQYDPELTYSSFPLSLDIEFDFIFIDGRRRMECALTAAVICHPNTIICIHDYRRGRYQTLRTLFDIVEDGAQFRVMKPRVELIKIFGERRTELRKHFKAIGVC